MSKDKEVTGMTVFSTKEMEREALEKIRKIIGDLGPESFVGTAFLGCFEVAEKNIENDWWCSLLDRAESAEKRLKEALEAFNAERSRADLLKKENDILRGKILGNEDIETLRVLLSTNIVNAREIAMDTDREIVELADDPTSEAFGIAVGVNRRAKANVESYEKILDKLNDLRR